MIWIRRENCIECSGNFSGGCAGHWVEGNPLQARETIAPPPTIWIPESYKQRLERIATAVLAGIYSSPDGTEAYQDAPNAAVCAARALIAELDKEQPK